MIFQIEYIKLFDNMLETSFQVDTTMFKIRIDIQEYMHQVPLIPDSIRMGNVICIDNNNEKVTLLDCSCIRHANAPYIHIVHNGVAHGMHCHDLESLKILKIVACVKDNVYTNHLPFVNQVYPITSNITLSTETNISMHEKKVSVDGNKLTLTSKKPLSLRKFRDILSAVREVAFLCYGYFDTLTLLTIYAPQKVMLFNPNKTIYDAAKSKQCGMTCLTVISDINFSNAIPKWNEIKGQTGLVEKNIGIFLHYFLIAQNNDLPYELRLSILVQCIDGYIKKWHSKEARYYAIKRNPKEPEFTLKNSIGFFINLSPNTRRVFAQEIHDGSINTIIQKLVNTRVVFSHLYNKPGTILLGKSSRYYFNKLFLSWRIVLLEKMGIKVNVHAVNDILDNYIQ